MDMIRPLPPAEYIRLDLFPATILTKNDEPLTMLPDGDLRVVVTDKYVIVLYDTNSGPDIFFSFVLEEYLGRSADKKSYNFLAGEYLLKIARKQSCGCGSRLRGASVYPGVPRTIR